MTTPVRVASVLAQADLIAALTVRMRVFVQEQAVPAEIELDADDAHARHFLAKVAGRPVGTARVVIHNRKAKIGRMAVLQPQRRRGIGTLLLRRALTYAKRHGTRIICLHAQVHVIGFYERQGFVASGKVFNEAGIPHRKMTLPTANWRKPRVK